MDQDVLAEMNQLTQLFLARIDSLEKSLGLSRSDAASLLRQVFEKSSSLEVLALVYRDYGFAPQPADPDAEGDEQARREAAERQAPAERAAELARQQAEAARQQAEQARLQAEAARQAEEKQRLHEQALRQREAEARRAEEARQAEAAAQLAEAEARAAEAENLRRAAFAQRQQEIEAQSDTHALQHLLESEIAPEHREAAQSRLGELYQQQLERATSVRELENLATQLPQELPRHIRTKLMKQISARWEILMGAALDQADNLDELGRLTRSVILYWQICDLQNQPTTPSQRIYVRIVNRWLDKILTVPDLREVDMPPLTFTFNEESQLILTDEELFAETEKIWERFVKKRIDFTGSMKALKDLYNSQDWGDFYAPARKRILTTWNELTSEALEDREGFEGIGQVVRMGGSDLAVAAWIDTAQSWDELTEIQSTVELTGKRRDLYDILVEKFLSFADTEAKVRQAHSMLRSNALNWMMGGEKV